ncbi:MAG: fibronectin type III domain-containing protein, partial [Acidobacteria bacterium]|nr:fibronectin type III domain-containing protein [Acidobacteriota bacterium]
RPPPPPQIRWGYDDNRDIKGLAHALGKLQGWYGLAGAPSADTYPPAGVFTLNNVYEAGKTLDEVHFAETFAEDASSKLYHVVEYNDETVQHWYGNAKVTDGNCPQSKATAVAGQRVFSAGVGVVRFSAIGSATNWTLDADAGFLPTGRYAGGDITPTALHGVRRYLFVFYTDQVQVWDVPPDPNLHRLVETLDAIGCEQPGSITTVGDAVFFLSTGGYRGIVPSSETDRPVVSEIGLPINAVVQEPGHFQRDIVRSAYSPAFGHYISLHGTSADVYSYLQGERYAEWSFWSTSAALDYPALNGKTLWLRDVDRGRILKLEADAAYDLVHQDQTGDDDETVTGISTAAQAAAALTNVAAGDVDAYAAGSTAPAQSGPSANNASPFVAWRITEDPTDLVIATALLRPNGNPEDVTVEFEYSLQGIFTDTAGGVLECSDQLVGDDWKVVGRMRGWGYDAARVEGDRVIDAAGETFTVARDGGWRRRSFVVPAATQRLRIRIVDPNPAGLGGAPSNLAADARPNLRALLSWRAPVETGGLPITGYRIEVSENGGAFRDLVADTGTADTTYLHTGMVVGTTYRYRVSAINRAGTGPVSGIASATTWTLGDVRMFDQLTQANYDALAATVPATAYLIADAAVNHGALFGDVATFQAISEDDYEALAQKVATTLYFVGVTGQSGTIGHVSEVRLLTQAQFNAIAVKSATTFYLIAG